MTISQKKIDAEIEAIKRFHLKNRYIYAALHKDLILRYGREITDLIMESAKKKVAQDPDDDLELLMNAPDYQL